MKQYILNATHTPGTERSNRRRNRSNAETADWNELLSLSESNEFRYHQPQSTNLGIKPLYRLDELNKLNGVLYAKIA